MEPVTQPVTQPVTEQVAEPVTEPATEPVTTENVTDNAMEPVTQPVTQPVTEQVTEPVTEPATEPVTTENVTDNAMEPVTQPVTQPVTEGVTEPVTEPATEPVTTENVTDNATEPVTQPVTQPVTERVTELVTEPATEPVTTENVTDNATEPVTEPVTQPVTERVTEPVTEPATEPTTEPVTAGTCSCNQQVNYVLEGTSIVESTKTTDQECCDCCVQNDTCIGYTTVGANENSVTCTTFTSVTSLTSTPVNGSDISTAFLCKQNCSTLSKYLCSHSLVYLLHARGTIWSLVWDSSTGFVSFTILDSVHTCDSMALPLSNGNKQKLSTSRLATNRQVVINVDYCKCLCEEQADCGGYQVSRHLDNRNWNRNRSIDHTKEFINDFIKSKSTWKRSP